MRRSNAVIDRAVCFLGRFLPKLGGAASAAFSFVHTAKSGTLPLRRRPFHAASMTERHFRSLESDQITIEHLRADAGHIQETSRILLKTGVWPDNTVFPKKIPVIASDVAEWLQERGVRLIGLDLPSVDPIEAKILQNHHALARCGIAIVESLDLSAVDTGVYNLAALPLKIAGGDAAPLRAILWRE